MQVFLSVQNFHPQNKKKKQTKQNKPNKKMEESNSNTFYNEFMRHLENPRNNRNALLLSVSNNNIDNNFSRVRQILEHPNNKVTTLACIEIIITEEGLQNLIKGLNQPNCKVITLEFASLDIIASKKNSTVITTSMMDICKGVVYTLQNPLNKIYYLIFFRVGLDDNCIQVLSEGLGSPNCHIKKLDVIGNPNIGLDGYNILAETFSKKNHSLLYFLSNPKVLLVMFNVLKIQSSCDRNKNYVNFHIMCSTSQIPRISRNSHFYKFPVDLVRKVKEFLI